jgi:hypothetical protein
MWYKRSKFEELHKARGFNMKKNDWMYFVNALLFVDICSIFAIGLLLAFVIPSGGGRYAEKYFIGLHRHTWADLHFYLALLLIGLLILHVWLNWKWVVQSTKRYFSNRWKKALVGLSCAWLIVLLFGWVIMKF